jgi:hypothetical protein
VLLRKCDYFGNNKEFLGEEIEKLNTIKKNIRDTIDKLTTIDVCRVERFLENKEFEELKKYIE